MGWHTRGVQRVRAAVATPVRCRGALSAAWPVWRGICRKSVGTVADASAPAGPAGRLSTKRSDVSAGHGRVGTRPNDLDEIPGFLRIRRLGVRIPSGAPTESNCDLGRHSDSESIGAIDSQSDGVHFLRKLPRRPAERASRGGPADLCRPGRGVRSMLCASVRLAARRLGQDVSTPRFTIRRRMWLRQRGHGGGGETGSGGLLGRGRDARALSAGLPHSRRGFGSGTRSAVLRGVKHWFK